MGVREWHKLSVRETHGYAMGEGDTWLSPGCEGDTWLSHGYEGET